MRSIGHVCLIVRGRNRCIWTQAMAIGLPKDEIDAEVAVWVGSL